MTNGSWPQLGLVLAQKTYLKGMIEDLGEKKKNNLKKSPDNCLSYLLFSVFLKFLYSRFLGGGHRSEIWLGLLLHFKTNPVQ